MLDELEEALELILADIGDHPERRKKSVVSTTLTFPEDWDDGEIAHFRNLLENLFAQDIPFICIAGNDDDYYDDDDDGDDNEDDDVGDLALSDSGDVDEYPGLMEGPDLPLIVVGSVNSTGHRSTWSKGGPHVTLHAVGQDILCLQCSNDGEWHIIW